MRYAIKILAFILVLAGLIFCLPPDVKEAIAWFITGMWLTNTIDKLVDFFWPK